MKKRVLAGLLATMVLLSMSGCGTKKSDASQPDQDPPKVEDTVNGDENTSGEGIDEDASGDEGQGESTPGQKPGAGATKPDGGSTSKPVGSKPNNKPGSGNASNSALSGTMEEIMGKVYEGLKDMPNCSITEVNSDNEEYYLGTKDISFVRAIASEPMMSSVAHSVVLLQAKDGADLDTIKKQIKDNVDGRKWVCVGVEPENILVDNIGNYVLLVMDEDAKSIMKQFKSLSK